MARCPTRRRVRGHREVRPARNEQVRHGNERPARYGRGYGRSTGSSLRDQVECVEREKAVNGESGKIAIQPVGFTGFKSKRVPNGRNELLQATCSSVRSSHRPMCLRARRPSRMATQCDVSFSKREKWRENWSLNSAAIDKSERRTVVGARIADAVGEGELEPQNLNQE